MDDGADQYSFDLLRLDNGGAGPVARRVLGQLDLCSHGLRSHGLCPRHRRADDRALVQTARVDVMAHSPSVNRTLSMSRIALRDRTGITRKNLSETSSSAGRARGLR